MSDRGEFRAIYTVLIDGPDFQAFAPAAKLVFYTLKLSLGATGIGVIRALVPTLVEQTGHDAATISAALAELEDADWIRREHNVVWIVRGLEFEPGLGVDNVNHRKSIRRHIESLPTVGLVETFRSHYAQWFEESETHSDGIGKGSEGDQEPTAIRRKEKGERRDITSPREKPRGSDAKPARASSGKPQFPPEFEAAWGDYPHRAGGNSKQEAAKAWRARRREGVDAAAMHDGVRRYAGYCHETGKLGTEYVMQASRFFGTSKQYEQTWEAPKVHISPATGGPDPAAEWYALLRDNGLLTAVRDDFRATVDRLVASGAIPDRDAFLAQCKRVNWQELRNQSAERFAVAYIRDCLFTQRDVA